MKKIHLTQLKVLTLCITIFTNSLYSATDIYLENNYGAKLNYTTSSQEPEQSIGTNVRIHLGNINSISELFIRTTRITSGYASPYNLKRLLTQIENQEYRHPNDDAIISITPSGLMSWDMKVIWEPKSNISFEPLTETPKVHPTPQSLPTPPATEIEIDLEQLENEEALMAATTADERLNKIKAGALGPEYARKATEICEATYTQAEKLGKINLCSRLKKELMAPEKLHLSEPITPLPQSLTLKINPKTKTTKQPRPTTNKIFRIFRELAPAIEDIKNSINRIHNGLIGYKTRGEAA